MTDLSLYVTLNKTRYLVQSPWGEFKPGPYTVSDVAVDANGHILVLVRRVPFKGQSGPAIIELDPEGRLVREWASEVVDAHYLTVTADNRVLVVDRDSHVVVIYDQERKVVGELGRRGYSGEPLSNPCDVAVDGKGDYFVADGYGAAKVHRFSPDGKLLDSWGETGWGEGQLLTPHSMLVLPPGPDGEETLLISDRDKNLMSVYSKDGRFLRNFGSFYRPTSAEYLSDGTILINDHIPRSTVYTVDGILVGNARSMTTVVHGFQQGSDGSIFAIHMTLNTLTRLKPVEQL